MNCTFCKQLIKNIDRRSGSRSICTTCQVVYNTSLHHSKEMYYFFSYNNNFYYMVCLNDSALFIVRIDINYYNDVISGKDINEWRVYSHGADKIFINKKFKKSLSRIKQIAIQTLKLSNFQ